MSEHTYDLGMLHHGDCLEVLRGFPSDSVDSVVSDPPAGIAFMGKNWDDPNSWQYPISKHGFTDGGDRVAAPAISTARNPNCRKCKRHKRGWKDVPGCECAEPDFDGLEKHLESRDIFVGWLTEVMKECLRVLKPGGHALIWSIPRTSHWTGTALEEAGFEIRDSILHLFGQGFPKSLNVGKAIDKMARGCGQGKPDPESPLHGRYKHQKVSGNTKHDLSGYMASLSQAEDTYEPATPEAEQWEGWGTSLKPAVEIWWLVRKPLREKTVAEQVLKTGTGGINIDASRVATSTEDREQMLQMSQGFAGRKWGDPSNTNYGYEDSMPTKTVSIPHGNGRWPANVVLTHSPECKKLGTKKVKGTPPTPSGFDRYNKSLQEQGYRPGEYQQGEAPLPPSRLDESGQETVEDWECVPGCPVGELNGQSGQVRSAGNYPTSFSNGGGFTHGDIGHGVQGPLYSDQGGASRFFHNFEPDYDVPFFYTGKITAGERKEDLEEEGLINKHPTVKTQKLMTFLVKLITPPGGTVLDPFAGSGSTLVAAVNNGFRFIGIERDPDYLQIAKGRLDKAVHREVVSQEQSDLFDELMGS